MLRVGEVPSWSMPPHALAMFCVRTFVLLLLDVLPAVEEALYVAGLVRDWKVSSGSLVVPRTNTCCAANYQQIGSVSEVNPLRISKR